MMVAERVRGCLGPRWTKVEPETGLCLACYAHAAGWTPLQMRAEWGRLGVEVGQCRNADGSALGETGQPVITPAFNYKVRKGEKEPSWLHVAQRQEGNMADLAEETALPIDPKALAQEREATVRMIDAARHYADEEMLPLLKRRLADIDKAMTQRSRARSEEAKVESKSGKKLDERRTTAARAHLAELRGTVQEARVNEIASAASYLVQRAKDDPMDREARNMAAAALTRSGEKLGGSRFGELLQPAEKSLERSIEMAGEPQAVRATLLHAGFAEHKSIPISGALGNNDLRKLEPHLKEIEHSDWVQVGEVKHENTHTEEEYRYTIFRTPLGYVIRSMELAVIGPFRLAQAPIHYLARKGF